MSHRFMMQCAHALRAVSYEVRTGIVLQDVGYIAETAKRLDWLLEQMEAMAGDCASSTALPKHKPPSSPPRELLQLRQQQRRPDSAEEVASPAPRESSGVRAPASLEIAPSLFRSGQVWERADGTVAFTVVGVGDQTVAIQWRVHGRFELGDRVQSRDLTRQVQDYGFTLSLNAPPPIRGQTD